MRLGELNNELFHIIPDFQRETDNYGQIVIYTGLMRDPKDDSVNPNLVPFEEEPDEPDLAFGWDPNVNYEDKDEDNG